MPWVGEVVLTTWSIVRKFRIIALSVCLALLTAGVAQGAPTSSVTQGISDVNGSLTQAQQDQAATKQTLAQAEGKLAVFQKQYQSARAAFESSAAELYAAGQARLALSQQLAQEQALLDERAAQAYEAGPGLGLEAFLGSSSLSDYASVQEYASRVFSVSQGQIDHISALRQGMDEAAKALEQQQQQLLAAKQRLDQLGAMIMAELEAAKAAAELAGRRVADLELQQQQLLAEQAALEATLASAMHVSDGCASGLVHDLILADFRADQVAMALGVATRESNCRPDAYNPTEVPPYGHAQGVFQILYPGIWSAWTKECGWEGADPYDPVANVAVSACIVDLEGWGPWGF